LRLRDYALAALGSTVEAHARAQHPSAELSFLLAHLDAVTSGESDWETGLRAYITAPGDVDGPLFALARRLDLSLVEMLAIELAATVERDAMAGRAVAYVQAPLGGSRPTIGLVEAAFGRLAHPGFSVGDLIVTGAAVRTGALLLTGEGAPLPERAIMLPLHLCVALVDRDGTPPGVSIGIDQESVVPLPPSTLAELQRQAVALGATPGRVLVIRSGSMLEARSIAGAIADVLGDRAAFLDPERTAGAGPWLLLRRLLPVFTYTLGPGERRQVPSLPGYEGPRLALLGPEGSVESASGTALSWRVDVPSVFERARLWQVAIGDHALAEQLATRHRHGSGRIAHLGRLARHQQAIAGRASTTVDDVAKASWTLESGGLEALAEPLPDRVSDEALVLTPQLQAELNHLVLRCRWRGELVDRLGASSRARYHAGVRALFVGPSGTGKTLAAGWLATRLGLPLYRVDLASVTSKYIGETEKNLAQLLARAEQSEVVLLFDEADSMFGTRTDVRDSNDRFANAQTNYLLQRIESYEGIALLTSNSRGRFDASFMRRLDFIVEFPLPGPEERRALWYSHLGTEHDLDPRTINMIAARAELVGGHIRNAVLGAALRARHGGRCIVLRDVLESIGAEYQKLGKQVPAELRAPTSGLDDFRERRP
jgi:hypothetical protein